MSGESRAMNTALETINAAATAIAMADNRVHQASVRKRRWSGCLGTYWCFGAPRNRKRIGHVVPEIPLAGASGGDGSSSSRHENRLPQALAIALPFVAPPSSPASFLHSEPPSATQSPAAAGALSIAANMYSPGGPSSIFAIGPYAHETQLVSPPVFSTFTTEPSTAPFTPPPESVHLTTPSSPEVPFARLLDQPCPRFPIFHYHHNSNNTTNSEFQSYHLQPGSPLGQLISPSSGASSPLSGSHFLEFRVGNAPTILNLDKLSNFDWGSRLGSGSLTPEPAAKTEDSDADHRVSFDLKPMALSEAVSTSLLEKCPEFEEDVPKNRQSHRSITLGSSKEFHFDSVEAETGCPNKPGIGSDWWANEKVAGNEAPGSQDWSFFSIVQPSVS